MCAANSGGWGLCWRHLDAVVLQEGEPPARSYRMSRLPEEPRCGLEILEDESGKGLLRPNQVDNPIMELRRVLELGDNLGHWPDRVEFDADPVNLHLVGCITQRDSRDSNARHGSAFLQSKPPLDAFAVCETPHPLRLEVSTTDAIPIGRDQYLNPAGRRLEKLVGLIVYRDRPAGQAAVIPKQLSTRKLFLSQGTIHLPLIFSLAADHHQ